MKPSHIALLSSVGQILGLFIGLGGFFFPGLVIVLSFFVVGMVLLDD